MIVVPLYFIPANSTNLSTGWIQFITFVVGMGILLVVVFLVCGLFTPYRQRNQARKYIMEMEAVTEKGKYVLGIIGGIEFEIIKGKQLQEKLRHSIALDIYLKGEFVRWFDEVGEYLQRKLYSEYAPWVRAAFTSDKASLDDLVKACDQGLNQLVDLQRRLTNSSIPDKKGSQS